SYVVEQRRREIGIRMALGAQRYVVLGLILTENLPLIFGGILLGVLATTGLTRVLRSVLVSVSPTDQATFIELSIAIAAVAFLACLIPARRAAGVDPVESLRCE